MSRERLCDFVRRIRNEKGLSLIDVSKQSAIFGPSISGSYVSRIERNPKVKVTLDKLTALAHGLGIPVEEMFAHALRTMSRDEADELSLVTRFKELPPKRQADVWSILLLWHSERKDPSTSLPSNENGTILRFQHD